MSLVIQLRVDERSRSAAAIASGPVGWVPQDSGNDDRSFAKMLLCELCAELTASEGEQHLIPKSVAQNSTNI